MTSNRLPHIFAPPAKSVPLAEAIDPIFNLDGYDYFYDDGNRVYYAVDPITITVNNGVPSEVMRYYYDLEAVKKAAVFSFQWYSENKFSFYRTMEKPVKIRLLDIQRMIQVHQIMQL